MLVGECQYCGKYFLKKREGHIFCSRKCFFNDYLSKQKKFPSFICPECGAITELDFKPKTSGLKWHNFYCPNCGYGHMRDSSDDYEEIRKIKIEFREEDIKIEET